MVPEMLVRWAALTLVRWPALTRVRGVAWHSGQ